jgi:hypothetical protein
LYSCGFAVLYSILLACCTVICCLCLNPVLYRQLPCGSVVGSLLEPDASGNFANMPRKDALVQFICYGIVQTPAAILIMSSIFVFFTIKG